MANNIPCFYLILLCILSYLKILREQIKTNKKFKKLKIFKNKNERKFNEKK